MEELAIDVWPEFLDDEGCRIDPDIESPLGAGVAEVPLAAWIVEARKTGGSTGTNDFAEVERVMTRVGSRDHGAADRIARALERVRRDRGCSSDCLHA